MCRERSFIFCWITRPFCSAAGLSGLSRVSVQSTFRIVCVGGCVRMRSRFHRASSINPTRSQLRIWLEKEAWREGKSYVSVSV